jgi:hypothetical protein
MAEEVAAAAARAQHRAVGFELRQGTAVVVVELVERHRAHGLEPAAR